MRRWTLCCLPYVPRALASLDTPAQHTAKRDDLLTYARALGKSLTSWRTLTRGTGHFQINVISSDPTREGPSGIVCVTYVDEPTVAPIVDTTVNDGLVLQTLAHLRESGLSAIPSGDLLALVPDVHAWIDRSLYLVRPLSQRSWTIRQALRDAGAHRTYSSVSYGLRNSRGLWVNNTGVWLSAFPIQPATEAVEALRQAWFELAKRPRTEFNPKTRESALTKRMKIYIENYTARQRGLLGMWAAEDIIGRY